MVNLLLQKRLAASELKCGKRRVYLEPNTMKEIATVSTRAGIRKLIMDGYISKKRVNNVSRFRTRSRNAAKRLGRHTGFGKRRGTREARTPSKRVWIERQRCLRRMLKHYRDNKHIDNHLYHTLYLKIKGNDYKNKGQLLEAIINVKESHRNEKAAAENLRVRQEKANEIRQNRLQKIEQKRLSIALGTYQKK